MGLPKDGPLRWRVPGPYPEDVPADRHVMGPDTPPRRNRGRHSPGREPILVGRYPASALVNRPRLAKC